ncbi:glutamyl-tRNA reductase-binding protein, chloroplastic isoform X2 [Triticum urartu]|uniref:glutamyl-tRNA reductase-binding protein, chloroplastic isoform X2 n=1 Tax=Triticum urartu TaxID=4572 RepID=UPI0020432E18|nr:glutamyl-tRNA reductase-binding protein, chloroplastic isoform X2 [Triticum urartu]
MSLTSPSLLSSPLPSRGALVFNKPSASSLAVSTARRGVRVVAEAAAVSSPASSVSAQRTQPSAAEVARTVVELAPSGTLSVVGADGWPLGVGARFVADAAGAPVLCLAAAGVTVPDARASFHVEFRQSGARTPQCTFLGALTKPSDKYELKKLSTRWETKFGEEIDEDRLYLISVERILHMEDFNEGRVWVVPSEYSDAEPDPLRNFAESVVEEMNSEHAEDVHRIYNIYAESDFQALDVKMIWVDRLGFDLHVHSEEGIFAVRIPFSRQVSDQKAVKSSFNMMAHHAWEVDKSYATPEFEKVQFLKKVT